MPSHVKHSIPLLNRRLKVRDEIGYSNTDFSSAASKINDSSRPDSERKAKLRKLFKTKGIRLSFSKE